MPRKSRIPKPKTWAEKWGAEELDFSISTPELRKLTKKVANLTSRRIASIEKQGWFSYAGDKLEKELKNRTKPISKMNRFELSALLADYHHFWQGKTSTVRGAREEIIIQSKRIFGVDEKGKPARIMTRSEAEDIWALHDEFELKHPNIARYDSNRLQQVVGEMFVQGGEKSFENTNVTDFIEKVRARMEEDFLIEEEEYARKLREMDEVYHGGNDYDF